MFCLLCLTAAAADPMTDMMSLIQQGVKLKPVREEDRRTLPSLPSDVHTQQLREALDRMQKRMGPSDTESGDEDGEDANFFD